MPQLWEKGGCPPGCKLLNEELDLGQPVYAIIKEFDLAGHVGKMREKHPEWSYRQLSCCLYWQPTARKCLRACITGFLVAHPDHVAIPNPEAAGVNVTETLRLAGVRLEWPPRNIVKLVALAGIPKNNP